jgi:hypothetical protein
MTSRADRRPRAEAGRRIEDVRYVPDNRVFVPRIQSLLMCSVIRATMLFCHILRGFLAHLDTALRNNLNFAGEGS